MGFSFKAAAAVALAGGALLTYYANDAWSRAGLFKASAALWIAQLAVWGIWTIFVYPHFISPLRHLPGPGRGHWLLGQGPRILADKPGAPMREWVVNIPNDGVLRYLWFFNRERIIVCSPKALAEVLATNNYAFQKPENVRSGLGRILGYGLLLAEGDEHKRQRRNLMPAFAFRHIKDLYPLFWGKSRELVQAMTAHCGGEGPADMEVGTWASRGTMDIIGVAGLGRDFHAIQNEDSELVQAYQVLFRPSPREKVMAMLGTFIPTWLLHRLPVNRNGDMSEAARRIRGLCRDVVRERKKAKLAANKEEAPDVDILSVALESGQFSDEDLVDQLMTFLAAGHETTATAMIWAVYLLCRHPEVQERLRDEVRARLPSTEDAGAEVTSVDIDRMPYLNAVCSEVLRCYSPVTVTIREAAYDTTILGHAVRKGTRVVLSPWAVNADPKLWGPDAAEFKPERWIPAPAGDDGQRQQQQQSEDGAGAGSNNKKAASGGASSNYAFMTFLHGPRGCIGQSFARAELACLLAAWVGRFEFELLDKAEMDEANMDIEGGVTAKPAKGLHVRARVVDGY